MNRHLRKPRAMLAVSVAIVSFGVLSSSVGNGALPTSTLPVYGVTNGDGSRTTVAELGDINGDGIDDYAVGLPSADVDGSADAGIVYVFLGHPGALPPTPTALNLGAASFTISGHAGEMLGFSIAGDDVNGDGLADIAIGAPMAGAPSKSGGGAVYVIFGSHNPQNVQTSSLYPSGAYTNDPTSPAAPSPIGSRYDGFQQNAHTGEVLAALPDLNGDGYNDLAVGSSDADLHIPGGGGVAVLYGKPQGVHITLNDLWENGYPYFFHIDFPSLQNQHVGESLASVGDMTGDGWPDLAIGAPQADNNGRADSGSVWIISGHLPDIGPPPCYTMTPPSTCNLPWIKLNNLSAVQGYRIDGAAAGDGLGSSLAGVGDENGDGIPDLAIGESAASPNGRTNAGEVVVVAGQHGSANVDLATKAPLQTIDGAAAGDGLGYSLAAAGDIDGDGHVDMLVGAPGASSDAGAAYLVRGAPGTTSDLASASSAIAPAGAGAMTGSAVAAGFALDGSGADALVAAPGVNGGAGGAFVIGGSGTPILPPPPGTPVTPPAITTTTTSTSTSTSGTKTSSSSTKPKVVTKPKKKLPLCPLKKPKPKYHIVKGKRVKIKPKPCRPRPKHTAKKKTTTKPK